jgi:hypothetical protein
MIAFSDQRGAREDPEIRSLGHAGGRHRTEVMRERGVAVVECLLLAPEGDVVGVEGRNRRVVWNPGRRRQDGALATVREWAEEDEERQRGGGEDQQSAGGKSEKKYIYIYILIIYMYIYIYIYIIQSDVKVGSKK